MTRVMPEMWDVQDRCVVQHPNVDGPQLVRHSSQAAADRLDLALASMRPEAQERLARLLQAAQLIKYLREQARLGDPVL